MDVIAMHQGGFTNAVATLGTAITPDQARLMSRYAKEIVVAYDSDKAGQAATQKAIQYLTDAGLTVKVLKITGGKDPDEFIRTYGADRFKLLLEGSENHVEYRLMEKMAKYNLKKPDEKVAYLKDAAVILSEIASPVERDVYAGRTAEISDISKASILLEVERILKAKAKKNFKQALRKENAVILGVRDIINPEKAKNLKIAKSEEGLIGILYRHQDKIKEVSAKTKININHFKTRYDCVSCVIVIVLSFLFFGFLHFEGVKLGTVICALINGRLIGIISKQMEKRFNFTDLLPLKKYFI
jgi:DNA primase